MKKNANVAVFITNEGCPHACSFCNQRSISGSINAPTPIQAAQILAKGLQSLGEKARNSEAAFFGGSFTAINEDFRIALLEAAQPYIGDNGYRGIRISTRPDCIDDKIIAQLKKYHVTTVELGVESMDGEVLTANNRGHTAEDVRKASKLIKESGLALGNHMMTGLYRSSPEKDLQTAKTLITIAPDTMRIHPTLVIAGTGLAELYQSGEYAPQSIEAAIEICAALLRIFTHAGINVIRLGLHDEASMREQLIAGPYHPAFRELCEGKILLDEVLMQLTQMDVSSGAIELRVSPDSISKMAGQNRRNLIQLEGLGYRAKIIPDNTVAYLEVRVRAY